MPTVGPVNRWKPRNLRVLVIDDQAKDLKASFDEFDKVPILEYGGVSISPQGLGTWASMLELLARWRDVDFDLLVIDVRFHHDATDPEYFGEVAGAVIDESAPNPMGLLYGLTAAAMYASRSLPFAFAVYSGGASSVMADPVAVACYGMLRALEGHVFSAYCDIETVGKVVSAMVGEVPADGPDGATSRALQVYRQRLREFVRDTGGIDRDTNLVPLLEACNRAVNNGRTKELRDQGIVLRGSHRADMIRLGSLFADCRHFSARDVEAIIVPELSDLLETYDNSHEDLYTYVVECIETIEKKLEDDAGESRSVFLDSINGSLASGVGGSIPREEELALAPIVCTYVLMWQEQQAGKRDARYTLLGRLGLDAGNQTTVDRLLKNKLKRLRVNLPRSLGKLIAYLKRGGRLPEKYRLCGVRYATEIAQMDPELIPFLRRQ